LLRIVTSNKTTQHLAYHYNTNNNQVSLYRQLDRAYVWNKKNLSHRRTPVETNLSATESWE